MRNTKTKIFTFLEPVFDFSPYLNLCIKTWKKNLPDNYELVILNQNNLSDYVSKNLLPDSSILNEENRCSFLRFFDYIACAVLHCNGGIFLDADTIMTPKFNPVESLLEHSEVVFFGHGKNNITPGFIMANKNSEVLEELIRRYVFSNYLPLNKDTPRNFIINDVLKEYSNNEITVLDAEEYGYSMEKAMYGMFDAYLYKKYYFTSICSAKEFLKNSKGLSGLHNSLTPKEYKKMSEEEFLNQDILLAQVLKAVL